VASREDLLDLVLDELVAAVPVSRLTGEWRVDVAALARDVRAALLRRRDLTLLLTARLGQGAGGLAALDRALGIFLRAGFSPRDAVRSNHALGAYVSGSCTWEAVGLGGEVDPAERVAAAASELFAGTAEDRFEFGLARLLEGFAVELAATAAHPPRLVPSSAGEA
jgi:TetR/AcrR family tetracycline transcriptional repressor